MDQISFQPLMAFMAGFLLVWILFRILGNN